MHYLLRQMQTSGTDIPNFIEILTDDPLKYRMDNSIPIVSILATWYEIIQHNEKGYIDIVI